MHIRYQLFRRIGLFGWISLAVWFCLKLDVFGVIVYQLLVLGVTCLMKFGVLFLLR